ncbi:MAG: hypothetical protein SFT94_00185 [Pseudanabaenaceae cyanobacterium bins.68]|nr:hypothetical protein [Pseudanabaenaceae cyanobacterium bins.68]
MESSIVSVVATVQTPDKTLGQTLDRQISTPESVQVVPGCSTRPKNQVSACRFCRHFQPTGRRGGECELLQSHVEGDWSACNLAEPGFADLVNLPGLPQTYPLPVITPLMSPSLANVLVNAIS